MTEQPRKVFSINDMIESLAPVVQRDFGTLDTKVVSFVQDLSQIAEEDLNAGENMLAAYTLAVQYFTNGFVDGQTGRDTLPPEKTIKFYGLGRFAADFFNNARDRISSDTLERRSYERMSMQLSGVMALLGERLSMVEPAYNEPVNFLVEKLRAELRWETTKDDLFLVAKNLPQKANILLSGQMSENEIMRLETSDKFDDKLLFGFYLLLERSIAESGRYITRLSTQTANRNLARALVNVGRNSGMFNEMLQPQYENLKFARKFYRQSPQHV